MSDLEKARQARFEAYLRMKHMKRADDEATRKWVQAANAEFRRITMWMSTAEREAYNRDQDAQDRREIERRGTPQICYRLRTTV